MILNSLSNLLYFFSFFILTNTSIICDEDTLNLEIHEDLADNGVLDCLRKIPSPLHSEETIEQTNKRILAQWDTACSFEAEYNWLADLEKSYGIKYLLDEKGERKESNAPDQVNL